MRPLLATLSAVSIRAVRNSCWYSVILHSDSTAATSPCRTLQHSGSWWGFGGPTAAKAAISWQHTLNISSTQCSDYLGTKMCVIWVCRVTCDFYFVCVLVLLLPVVQDVNLRITHNVIHLRDIKGIVYPSQNVIVSIFTYPHLVLNSYAFFQIPNYSQKVHKQCKQECKLLWGHFCYYKY